MNALKSNRYYREQCFNFYKFMVNHVLHTRETDRNFLYYAFHFQEATKTEFLLTISKQRQAAKWWE